MRGMTEEKESYETTFWGEVLQTALNYGKNSKLPYGWYWLVSLHYLLEDSIKDLQNHLPEKHPLQLGPLDLKAFNKALKGHDNYLKPRLNGIKQKFNITEIKKIDFSGLPFENEIDFSNFIFPIDADFSKATFSKDVFFNNAVFCETADFEDAEFQTKDSYCKETAKFRNTVFEKIANFRNATFWGYANFKGAELKGRAFFQKAKFKWHAPRFYDATFNNEMTWAGIELPKFAEAKVDRYKKVGEEFEPDKCDECTECAKCKALIKQNRRRRIEENQNSYENTSILLEKHRKYHDEHFFFRKEMQCRRWLGSPFSKTIHFLYEKIADYGYGVGRALFYWALHIAFGACFIAGITSFFKASIYSKNVSCAISVSFANANPYAFLCFSGKKLMGCYTYFEGVMPINIAIINVVQTVVGVALLFLLLLTLRVRFRLK